MNPGERDVRPGWLKFVDNPLGETIRAVNKVEDKISEKMAQRKKKKQQAKLTDEEATVATYSKEEENGGNTEPLLPAAAF